MSSSGKLKSQSAQKFDLHGADVFLETERKDYHMSGPEERRRAVYLYSATPMTTAQVVEHLGYPTWRCLERWLAKDPRACRSYGETHHPAGDGDQGDRTGAGRHARKRAAERLGAGVGAVPHWVRTYREGGMAALRPKNRNDGQPDKPAMRRDRDTGDAEALRRRIEEPELGNAVMREVVEARRKRPGRRPAAPVEQGEDAAGSRQPRRPRFHGRTAE